MEIFNKDFNKFIEKNISKKINDDFFIENIEAVMGGDINQAYRIESRNRKYFIKINRRENEAFFKAELIDLKEILKTKSILTPAPICVNVHKKYSFIVLEHIDFKNSNSMRNLAKNLASLHHNTKNKFGYNNDNFIGRIKQNNSKKSDWVEFFINNRLRLQIELLELRYSLKKLKQKANIIFQMMPELFINHRPKASLLHGDLWQGNYGFTQQDQAIIYDPACYYGDHEADLAMMELFSNPGQEFFECYQQHFPIDKGYSKRKTLYNLYHILNHANMFGGHYVKQAEVMMDHIIKSV